MGKISIRRIRRTVGVVVAAAFVAAACGGDDSSGAPADTTAPPTATDPGPDDTGADDTGPGAETTADGNGDGNGTGAVAGGELVIAPAVSPTQIDPHKQVHAGEEPFLFAFYDRLTVINDDMTVGPLLATEWTIADDGLSLTMQLRDDVSFNDGTPFDAEAVVANIERGQTMEGSTVAGQLAVIDGVEAIGSHEVVFELNRPMASLPATFAGAAGAMVSPQAIADGTDLGQDPGTAGSGPYMAESITMSERFVLVPSPDYWDATVAQLDRLTIEIISDQQTRLNGLQTGEIDATAIGADPSDVANAEQLAAGDQFDFYSRSTTTLMGLMMRSERAGTDDAAIRRAIVGAIDSTSIVDGLLAGTCTASTQIYPPGTPGHVEDFDPVPYDGGAALAAEGIGGPLEMYIIAGLQPFARIGEVVQAQLQAGGLETEITPLASNEALANFRADETDFWMYQLTGSFDPALTVSDYILGDRFGSTSQEIADAVDAAQAVSDPSERDLLLQDLTRAVADEAVIAPICFLNTNWLAHGHVSGVEQLTTPYSTFAFDVRYLGHAG